jgi:hypothetical protein
MDTQNIKNNAIAFRKVSNISKYETIALGQISLDCISMLLPPVRFKTFLSQNTPNF